MSAQQRQDGPRWRRLLVVLAVLLTIGGLVGLVSSVGMGRVASLAAPQASDGGAVPTAFPTSGDDPPASRPDDHGTESDRSDPRGSGLALSRAGEGAARALARTRPTSFLVASFNLLGASHTRGNEGHLRFTDAATRMRWTVRLVTGRGISVAGFQEFQPPQHAFFERLAPGWSVFPGRALGRHAMVNAVAWSTDVWERVRAETVQVPYFHGRLRPMPYLLLRHRISGQKVWFANFHNPADAHGPAQAWREAATDRQVALADRLTSSGTPVVFTGDMNDREEYFCPMTAHTRMHAANGGSTGPTCSPPPAMGIDWLLGSAPVRFTGYVASDAGLVGRASDHPLVYAEATVPPRQ